MRLTLSAVMLMLHEEQTQYFCTMREIREVKFKLQKNKKNGNYAMNNVMRIPKD